MSCLAIAGLGPHELPQTERRAVAKAGADEACTAMLALMRGECGGPADAAKAKARSVVAGATNDPLVQQLLDNNAHLKAELNRMELKCATAEGIALGKAPYMEDLHNQLKAANEQIAQLRLAHSKSDKEAAEEIASLKATNEALRSGGRTKAPGEGRGPGLAKIEEEPAYRDAQAGRARGVRLPDALADHEPRDAAPQARRLRRPPAQGLLARGQAEHEAPVQAARGVLLEPARAQDTGKWPVGDADALFAYMMSTRDHGHGAGRVPQPQAPGGHVALAEPHHRPRLARGQDRGFQVHGPSRKPLHDGRARGPRLVRDLSGQARRCRSGHVEGVDPIPSGAQRGRQKRKAEAQERGAARRAGGRDLYVDGCEGDDARRPDASDNGP